MTQRLLLPGDSAPIPYNPVWGGGASAVGNGTLKGRYKTVGKLLRAEIELVSGSTTVFGAAIWTFTLPPGFAAVPVLSDQRQAIGHWFALQHTVGYWDGVIVLASATTFSGYGTGGYGNGLGSSTGPFPAWSNGDIFTFGVACMVK